MDREGERGESLAIFSAQTFSCCFVLLKHIRFTNSRGFVSIEPRVKRERKREVVAWMSVALSTLAAWMSWGGWLWYAAVLVLLPLTAGMSSSATLWTFCALVFDPTKCHRFGLETLLSSHEERC